MPSLPLKASKRTHNIHGWFGKEDEPMSTYTPDADLRETSTHFYLDLEVPGVSDKSSIRIHWTSSRLLVVEGEIIRPKAEISAPVGANGDAQDAKQKSVDEDSVATKDQYPHHESSLYPEVDGMRLTACERRIGHFIRYFSFPVDVDRSGMKARLEAGLLQMQLPKWQESNDKWTVEIE